MAAKNPVTVSVAMASTRHFDFFAVGETPEEAREALWAGWDEHITETGDNPDDLTDDGINVITGPFGQAWRDYTPLIWKD